MKKIITENTPRRTLRYCNKRIIMQHGVEPPHYHYVHCFQCNWDGGKHYCKYYGRYLRTIQRGDILTHPHANPGGDNRRMIRCAECKKEQV